MIRYSAARPRHRRWATPLAGVLAASALVFGVGGSAIRGGREAPGTDRQHVRVRDVAYSAPSTVPDISLGHGFLAFPDAARAWVAAHPNDPRTPLIKQRIASQPTALWLTDNDFDNLDHAVTLAKAWDRTLQLVLWNIPMRWDGLSDPSSVTLSQYKVWVDRIADSIGWARAAIVLEPDALWFYDRLYTEADRTVRLAALRYAINAIAANAPNARVYLDAGTSSGSVTADRMAALLFKTGIRHAAGYAVDVSSFSPTSTITAYAQQIRAGLRARGIADPRYVVDSGRNGAATWNTEWCNPPGQRLGAKPALVLGTNGLDLNLWVKGPGTSDGNCGTGAGSYGGQFLPKVAFSMITG